MLHLPIMTKRKKKPAGTGKQTPKTLREKTRKNLKEMEKSDAERNNRKKKLLIAALIGGAVLIAAGVVLAGVLVAKSLGKTNNAACIAVPKEGGFVEAWTPQLEKLAERIGFEKISIETYSSYQNLNKLFSQADKRNLLWAEVPLSNKFPVHKLYEDKILSEILLENIISQYYPQSLVKIINKSVTGSEDDTIAIPISYNPMIRLYKSDSSNDKFVIDTATPGSTDELLLSSFTFFRSILSSESHILSVEETLEKLKGMSNDSTIQRNAYSYTPKDAQNLLIDNLASKVVISVSDLAMIPNEITLQANIHSMGKILAADVSFALFPKPSNGKSRNNIRKAQEALLDPDMLYYLANSRNWLPAYIGTVAKNVYTDFTRKQARQTKVCLVPDLQYANDEEYKKLLSSIKEAFSSKYVLEKTE